MDARRFDPDVSTLAEVLRERARRRPDELALSFLEDGETRQARLSFADLDHRATAWAARLARRTEPGDRVLLAHPAGLDFAAALFGSLYAGLVPVPVPGPGGGRRRKRDVRRLAAVAEDAAPALGITTLTLKKRITVLPENGGPLDQVEWLTEEEVDGAPDTGFRAAGRDEIALLQYTSGSTREPVGVAIRHRDLMEQLELYRQWCDPCADSVMVGWLPHYHDYGLIGFLIAAVYFGTPYYFMSPATFLKKPRRWLAAISRYRGTISGGPTFAFGLCARQVDPDEPPPLDLSSWRVASVGGEPVHAETLASFAAAFEACGLPRGALRPGYGLAEAVLSVSAHAEGDGPVAIDFDGAALDRRRVRPAAGDDGRRLVSCGGTLPGQELAIVDPATRTRSASTEVGEIWIRGRSIASGYWRRPELTRECFGAILVDDDGGPFLRTGDLGFLCDERLFVTGRIKGTLIVRGRNHAPQDLEWSVQDVDPVLRRDAGAAFLVEGEDGERLVVVQELESDFEGDPHELAGRVQQAITKRHGLHLHSLELIRPGALPRTTSGKIRRHECREAFLERRYRYSLYIRLAAAGADEIGDRDEIEEHVLDAVRSLLAPNAGADDSLFALGVDSLSATQIVGALETRLGVEIAASDLFENPTPAGLAARLRELLARREPVAAGKDEEPDFSRLLGRLDELTDLAAQQVELLGEIRDRLDRDHSRFEPMEEPPREAPSGPRLRGVGGTRRSS